MKTAVSVPDEVFESIERLARRLKKSRSQLYADALREYLARHDPEAITAALDLVHGDRPDEDLFQAEATRQALASQEWD